MRFRQLPFGPEDSLAKTSVSREWDPEGGCEAVNRDSSSTLLTSLASVAPRLLSSRTLQHSSLPTMDEISRLSFGRWQNSGMAWRGEYLTVDTSASPSQEAESSLSHLLEGPPVPDRYFLSPNAATGI